MALPGNRSDTFLIRVIVFAGGMTSLGTELSASRLLAPFFGTSTYIWANVIGFTLTFLAIGYWLGGKAADRYPSSTLLYTVTAIAACFVGITPWLSRPILRLSLDAFENVEVGAFLGSLIGVLVIIAVPITLLGFVSPFAIRLLVPDVSNSGNTSGNVYALGTFGSIAGSFLPVLVLIPWVGTTRTFIILALLLLLPSLAGLVRSRATLHASIAVLIGCALVANAIFTTYAPIRPSERGEVVYETESSDNYIQVVQDGETTYLSLNDGHAWHSIYNPNTPLVGGPWQYFTLAPLFTGSTTLNNAMIIGLAGGTVAKQLTIAYGPVPIDGVEIDPTIVEVGRNWFDMTEPNLNVIIGDGRYELRTSDSRYDLIAVDAYVQPYIPFQLCTQEFFQEVLHHLSADGVAIMNVGRYVDDFRLVDAISSTMRSVFPSVFIIDVQGSDNSMVIGTASPTTLQTFVQSLSGLPADSLVRTVAESAMQTGNPREVLNVSTIWTDDHAPVEQVIDGIILDAAREESEP